jgi:aryl-alcohol dehydrogenase-like predicted oxidoreductase
VRRSLEESLERLGLDRVDIVLVHAPDDFMEQTADEAYPALAELRAQGMVRAIGAGMNAAAPLAWLIERCDLDCVLVALHPARSVGRRRDVPAVPPPRRGGPGGRRVQQRHSDRS